LARVAAGLIQKRFDEGVNVDLRGWNERYRSRARVAEDFEAAPTPLLAKTIQDLAPGRALDLACGTGRNALWLANQGWAVTAVDGSAAAIEVLRSRAGEQGLSIDATVADLEKGDYWIDRERWDLIAICYYLQIDLFLAAKQSVAPGGIVLAIVHVHEPGEASSSHCLRTGELETYFSGWEILHSFEGQPSDPTHRRRVAEIVARRPAR
jgi:SAM-dependent methyltransferase